MAVIANVVAGTTITNPTTIYTSSGQNAITTIVICNVGTPDLTNENNFSANVNIYLVSPSGGGSNTTTTGNVSLIAKKLIVPAGESLIFSDERFVLANGDYLAVGYEIDANHDTITYPTYTNLLTVTVSTISVWNI